jgi:D-beta-D-heptose 7-phosphate kinase/D-beta-D-heptose 1-phosphate adenosyltransferase
MTPPDLPASESATERASDLAADLAALTRARVVVVGDAMLDRFLYGAVERISPEAPIPVLRIEREVAMLGGAGNVLRNLTALGVAAELIAVVGDDAPGREVAALAAAEAGERCRLLIQTDRPTTIKERHIAGGQQLLRTDRESTVPVDPATAKALVAAARNALADPAVGALILSDYGKGALSPEVIAELIAATRQAGRPVVADPKGRDFAIYRGASVLTPNRRELALATGLPTDDDAQVVAAGRAVADQAGIAYVLATRSEKGMSLVGGTGKDAAVHHLPAAAREVFDVSGAGDTVAAVLAAALAAGCDVVRAARLANIAAGIVVGKLGTAVAYPGEILRAHHATDLLAAEAKVVDAAGMCEQASRWRRAGLTVGFTNGCFDLLHPGHVSLLRQARAACDRLVVGLNSDASTRRLKGDGRPVQAEAARAAVLASLADTDLVVVFGEDTPLKLIEALLPDVLVKGADYTAEQVVGAEAVRRAGGRVLLAKLVPGQSTTGTIAKLNA